MGLVHCTIVDSVSVSEMEAVTCVHGPVMVHRRGLCRISYV